MDIFSNIALGLSVALTGTNLFYCFAGVFLGMLVGVIPGIGHLAAMSLLFPMTFYLDPTTALIMLAGIWYGSSYGGNTASILLNIPGSPANAVTCLDGYPMTKQGRGGVALFMTTIASFVGGSIGILLLMLFSPVIAQYALRFGPAEYFSLMVLALVATAMVSDGAMVKGLAMIVMGILLGTVGIDTSTGVPRFTHGVLSLMDGFSLIAIAMGIFGVTEVIVSVRKVKAGDIDVKTMRLAAMLPTREDLRRSWFPMLRGSGVGAFFGTLPGTGPTLAAFMSYAIEKRIAKDPSRFGKGAIEGITAPESANNSADQTSFIPTLALGIPGSVTMALMLGALMIHGITPGPGLMNEQPSLFWGLIMSFWLGNIILVVLNIPMIGIWVRLLMVPYHLLYPAVLAFICIGTYSVSYSAFDVWMVVAFGFGGYLMRYFDLSPAPLLLGFVLGPLLEENFSRSMAFSNGELFYLIENPISAVLLALTVFLLLFGIWSGVRKTESKDQRAPAP